MFAARVLWCGSLLAIASCVSSTTVDCAEGFTCPEATACAVVMIGGVATPMCVQPQQLSDCTAEPPTCAGTCHDGVCLPNVCGNLLVDSDEICDLGDDNGRTDVTAQCSLDCQSNMTCGNAIPDVATGEECDIGDFISNDGCSSTCNAEQPAWVQLRGAPPPRSAAGMVYDAQRGRTVLFGGRTYTTSIGLSDTYEWDGARWFQITSLQTPPVRGGHAMTYDSVRQRVVMFSGDVAAADTWTYDGAWHLENPPGAVPAARAGAGFAFDHGRGIGILFGGSPATGDQKFGDTWTWDGSAWTRSALVAPAAPAARMSPMMGYDPKRGVVVLYGGLGFVGSSNVEYSDTWEFDGTTWTQRNVVGPPTRYGGQMAFDPVAQKMVLLGGSAYSTGQDRQDSWTWDGVQWLPAVAPVAIIRQPALATDSLRGLLVLLGNNEASIYEGGAAGWTNRLPGINFGARPQPRGHAAVAMHVADHKLVVFGGIEQDSFQTFQGSTFGDTWEFDGVWNQIGGTLPSARHAAAIAYDAKRGEVVMYSGCYWNGANEAVVDTGTWIYKQGAWTSRTSTTLPPPVCGAAMAYDDQRERIVLFGGRDVNSIFTDTTWTWDGVNWRPETPATKPSTRWNAAMGADPIRGRVVLYGGVSSDDKAIGDTWLWDGTTWTQTAIGASPVQRRNISLAWDAARQRLVMFGGLFTAPNADDDTAWEWDGTQWSVLAVQSRGGRNATRLVTALDGGVIAFGGFSWDRNLAYDDLWHLRWSSTAATDVCTTKDIDGDGRAGCGDPDCWWACTPSCTPGRDCSAAPRLCGDGTCNAAIETCASCPVDCTCIARCGDLTCNSGETAASCPGDCR